MHPEQDACLRAQPSCECRGLDRCGSSCPALGQSQDTELCLTVPLLEGGHTRHTHLLGVACGLCAEPYESPAGV